MKWSTTSSRRLLRALPIVAAAVASPLAFGASPTVPFSGSFTTQEVLGIDPVNCPLTLLSGTTTGSGTATHLGATTGTGSDCISLTPSLPAQFNFTNGSLTLFAANGDQLHLSYGGTLSATRQVPVFSINGSFTIKGGTGRFATAMGNGTLSGFENLGTRQGQLLLNGVISY